jgi:hypothetical protein
MKFLKHSDGKYHNLTRDQLQNQNRMRVPTSAALKNWVIRNLELETFIEQQAKEASKEKDEQEKSFECSNTERRMS